MKRDIIRINVPEEVMDDFNDRTISELEFNELKPEEQLNVVISSLWEEGIEIKLCKEAKEIFVEELEREEVVV